MPGVDQVPGQQAGAAADLQHHTAEDRFKQLQDAGRRPVGVEAEPPVMYQREVIPVIRLRHSSTLIPRCRASNGPSDTSWTWSIVVPRSDSKPAVIPSSAPRR